MILFINQQILWNYGKKPAIYGMTIKKINTSYAL